MVMKPDMKIFDSMKKILYIPIAAILTASCSFLDPDPNVLTDYYTSEKDVLYGLAGIYGALGTEALYGNVYSQMASNCDDLCYYNRDGSSERLQQYLYDPTTSYITEIWQKLYKGIDNANRFLEAIEGSEFETKDLMAEARFLRAYFHFLGAQSFGDIPLKKKANTHIDRIDDLYSEATPQADILRWVISEMENALENISVAASDNAPSRVSGPAIAGVLARVCLFTAGESVKGVDEAEKTELLKKAQKYAGIVIATDRHRLNPDYSQVFINMISDVYDKEYFESIWEVDFIGHRETAEQWTNGRIGDVIGLQCSISGNYDDTECNYSYGMYNGSLKLWDLYWREDRTADEVEKLNDVRQEWNLPPYNYAGKGKVEEPSKYVRAGFKTPYTYDKMTTLENDPALAVDAKLTYNPAAAQAVRNAGKFRREVRYEGKVDAKRLYTNINYPLLRYSDVLLMYAEATNELDGPTSGAYAAVVQVRERAGIKTKELAEYDQDSFRELVRNERGRELCFESLRKYDLIRWGIFVEAMHSYAEQTADDRWSKNAAMALRARTYGTNVEERHIYLPIPSVELGVNSKLKQNPLW